ncbi:hypothetical protein [Nocardiopsis ansamitocini]|nr:hypothetical protein [Nocardiopsis ansamitocini]
MSSVELDHPESTNSPAPPPENDAELTAFLEDQESEWLAEQLMRIAEEDPVVRARLAAAAGFDSVVDDTRDLLTGAVLAHLPGLSEEGGPSGAPARLDRTLETLDDLVDNGYAAEVHELAREALELYAKTHGEDESEQSERLRGFAAVTEAGV